MSTIADDKKRLLVLRGPCGAGKTYLASQLFMSTLIDMKDCPNDCSYDERIKWLRGKLDAAEWPCVLEGIFAPNSPSWSFIKTYCVSRHIELQSVVVMRSIDDCRNAIPPNEHTRRRFLDQYWLDFTRSY